MSLQKCLLAVMMLLMGAAMVSCASKPNRSLGLRIQNPDGTWRSEPRVIINDRKVEKNMAIDAIDSRVLNGIMRAEVKARNLSSKTLAFAYRFTWADSSGYALESPGGGWREAWIQGYSNEALKGVAPNARATSFRLEVQSKE